MKKILFASAFLLTPLMGEENPPSEQSREVVKVSDIGKISEALGHLIGKNLESVEVKLDMALIVKGLQDAMQGKESPMTESECMEAIGAIHEAAFQKKSEENLEQANQFLADNKAVSGVVSVEEGKLQYKIEKEGNGAVVEDSFSPVVRYRGHFLGGADLTAGEYEEISLNLKEAIPGFSKGISGMKEGEIRKLFVHPDFAYGATHELFPNALLQFEVEIVKANSVERETNPLVPTNSQSISPEIALPIEDAPVMR